MPKFHPLKVTDIRRETGDCVSIAFDVPESLLPEYKFVQGQYLTLRKEINGEDVRRSYSICSSPFEQELRVAVKKVEGGRFSTYANEKLKAGDTLEVMTPAGNFFTPLNIKSQRTYVAFAAGSGITPIISIMKAVLEQERQSEFLLFYGNKSADSIIFKEEIDNLKNIYLNRLSVHHVLSRELLESDLFCGRISEDKCHTFSKIFFDPAEVHAFFLCGPESMIFSVSNALKSLGVPSDKVHYELFTSPVGKLGQKTVSEHVSFDPSKESQIKITVDGKAIEFKLPYKGYSILDAALKQGADLPFACKGGVCCTCKARLLEGKVEMDVNYALEPEEVAAGYILSCQSHPRTESVVLDFDV